MSRVMVVSILFSILILGSFGFSQDSFAGKEDIPPGQPFQNLEEQFDEQINILQQQIDTFDISSLFELFTPISEHQSDVEELQEQIDEMSSRLSFLESVLDEANSPPHVNAGDDRFTPASSLLLQPTAGDDGLVYPLTFEWSQVSGSGTATFDDPNSLETTVTFSEHGQYVLKIVVFDGMKYAEDTVSVEYDEYHDFIVTSSETTSFDYVLLGSGEGTFDELVEYDLAANNRYSAVGDFNNDGLIDIVSSLYSNPNMSLRLNLGDRTFGDSILIPTNWSSLEDIAVGDFNGDENLDIISLSYYGNSVVVLLGNGDGTFGDPLRLSSITEPTSVAVGDFNGDENLDFIVTHSYGWLTPLLGNGDGTFEKLDSFNSGAGRNANSVAVADFDHDENLDLVVATGWGFINILNGNGDGTFEFSNYIRDFSGDFAVMTGDFNEDGHPDIVYTNVSRNFVKIYENNGDGTFGNVQTRNVGLGPNSVSVGDFNRDNTLDIAVSNYRSDNISILLNDGDGIFENVDFFRTGEKPFSIAAASHN